MALELADIFSQYGPAYRQKYADRLLPSHRRAMRATPALAAQVQVLSSAAHQPWVARPTPARSATRPNTATTPAATATAQNARTTKLRNGWSNSRIFCCQSLTSCSLSPCPPPCAQSPAVTRRLSMTCSSVLPRLQHSIWLRIPALSADNSA